ncbi:MAG: DUF4249 family protein, partial [Calditrichaeota bacterium]
MNVGVKMKPCYRLFLALLLAGCSQNPVVDEGLNEIMVLAILSPDFTRQSVLLVEGTDLASIPEKPTDRIDNPVQHARVLLRGANQEVVFDEVSPGLYQDVQTPLEVVPGQTYSLEISDDHGLHITGRTTVPARFHILAPEPGLTVHDGERVPFAWEPSAGALFYDINLVLPDCARPPFHRRSTLLVGGSNALRVQDSVRVRMFPPCDSLMQEQQFKVIAVDTGYALYR